MFGEWKRATQNARRAFLAGNVEDMNKIKEVSANQFEKFQSILENLQTQLLVQAGSSDESSEALKIVEQQLNEYKGEELFGFDQVNLNLETVETLKKVHALAPTAISWESTENKLSSLLEELKSAGI